MQHNSSEEHERSLKELFFEWIKVIQTFYNSARVKIKGLRLNKNVVIYAFSCVAF